MDEALLLIHSFTCAKKLRGSSAAKIINGKLESSLPMLLHKLKKAKKAVKEANEQKSNTNKRCSFVDHLKEHRNSKLMEKVPADRQLLDVANEELAVKKDLLTQMM